MTLPVKFSKRGRFTDNDEPARRRASAISQIGKAYQAGGAYDDINSSKPAEEAFDAAKDYDLLRRVKPPAYKFKFKRPDGK